MITLEWWNTCDTHDVLYQMGWRQIRYYNADLSEPKHELTEEGAEDGDGEFHPLHQRFVKTYHFDVAVAEYELDALTLLPFHDQVRITDENGYSAFMKDIEVTPGDWNERFIRVDIYFNTQSYIKTPKCENMTTGLPA